MSGEAKPARRKSSFEDEGTDFNVLLGLVRDAEKNIKPYIRRYYLEKNTSFSTMTGANVFLKKENLQRTGSFKVRGALNALACLSEEQRAKGVCCTSAGNHAQGVAYAAQTMGIKATIFMPNSAPRAKVLATRGYGAEVVLAGDLFDDTFAACEAFREKTGAIFIHPFNNDTVIAGQGTIGLELAEDAEKQLGKPLDAVLVPIGGGGIAAGIAAVIKHLHPTTRVYGVQTANMPSMHASLMAGHVQRPKVVRPTFADGIAVQRPGELTYEAAKRYLDGVFLVEEQDIAKAIFYCLERVKNVVEPAGATALGGLLANKMNFKGMNVAVVLTGGNVDMTMLMRVIRSEQFALHRAVKLYCYVPDKPGYIADIKEVLTRNRVTLADMKVQRFLPDLPPTQILFYLHLEVNEARVQDNMLFDLEQLGYIVTERDTGYEFDLHFDDAISQ